MKAGTKIVIVVVAVLLVVWDLIAFYTAGAEASISWVMLTWAMRRPIIPFALGVVCGHLFWPQKPPITHYIDPRD